MENRKDTKSVVEAGILSALIVVLVLFVQFVPVLGILGFFILPIPVAVLYIKHGIKISVTALVVCIIISCMVIGIINGIGFGVQYGLTGLALGYCFKKQIKESKSLFILSIASMISYIFVIALNLLFINKALFVDAINELVSTMKKYAETSISMSGSAISSDQANFIRDQINNITVKSILTWIPAGIIMYSFVSAFINFILTRSILKRLRFRVGELVPFDRVYIDNRIGALMIISACLGIILQRYNIAAGDYIFNTALIVMNLTFNVIGAALIYYFAKNRLRLTKAIAVLITVGFFFMGGPLVFYIGFTDMIFDFRKVDPNRLFKSKVR